MGGAAWFLSVGGAACAGCVLDQLHFKTCSCVACRMALSNLPPLCLSPFSPSKPEFLSSFVMKEMDKFVTSIW